jgi:RNA methyltransferase, TrmH family
VVAVKSITSRDNATFKSLLALATDNREQKKLQQTLIDGIHLIEAYRDQCGSPRLLLLAESGLQNPEIVRLLAGFGETEALLLRDGLFRELSGIPSLTGIAALIDIPQVATGLAPEKSILMLDAVQDAGNVGSILRSTAAAGIADVFLGPGCAGAWSPRVLRAAQGAHFSLAIREQADLYSLLKSFSGTSIATLIGANTTIYELDLTPPLAWLFGSEGGGLCDELAGLATHRASIPIAANTESLNVGAAAAICLFEGRRRQRS